jgi:hypothetical protein
VWNTLGLADILFVVSTAGPRRLRVHGGTSSLSVEPPPHVYCAPHHFHACGDLSAIERQPPRSRTLIQNPRLHFIHLNHSATEDARRLSEQAPYWEKQKGCDHHLGEPSTKMDPDGTGSSLSYPTGIERDLYMPIDSEWLLVYFDSSGKVIRYPILSRLSAVASWNRVIKYRTKRCTQHPSCPALHASRRLSCILLAQAARQPFVGVSDHRR